VVEIGRMAAPWRVELELAMSGTRPAC
jgi:hypothetical protein